MDGTSLWSKYQTQLEKDKMSNIEPYTTKEMAYLQELFAELDRKNLKSIEVRDFEEIEYLREHALFSRIKDIFQEEMRKIKAKRINFQLFLYLLSTFHVRTELETKYKYVFRLYDVDKNMKIDVNDLTKIYKMIYREAWMTEEDYSRLVTESLIRFGSKGEIKQENLREMIPEDELQEFLSFRFDSKIH